MSIRRVAILSSAIAALLIAAVYVLPVIAAVKEGDKAPDFALLNIDGKSTMKLSDYTNKPTLLVFWVSWCPHCQREAPILDKLYRQYKDNGLNIVGVSVDDSIDPAKTFIIRYGLSFPNAFAGTEKGRAVLANYDINGVPVIFILDKNGVVKAHYVGETDETVIRNQLALLGVK